MPYKTKELQQAYYKNNKVRIKKRSIEYYFLNKSKICEYPSRKNRKKYYNKEKVSEWWRKYYAKNKTSISKRSKKFYEQNKERIRAKAREYRRNHLDIIKAREKERNKLNYHKQRCNKKGKRF